MGLEHPTPADGVIDGRAPDNARFCRGKLEIAIGIFDDTTFGVTATTAFKIFVRAGIFFIIAGCTAGEFDFDPTVVRTVRASEPPFVCCFSCIL